MPTLEECEKEKKYRMVSDRLSSDRAEWGFLELDLKVPIQSRFSPAAMPTVFERCCSTSFSTFQTFNRTQARREKALVAELQYVDEAMSRTPLSVKAKEVLSAMENIGCLDQDLAEVSCQPGYRKENHEE